MYKTRSSVYEKDPLSEINEETFMDKSEFELLDDYENKEATDDNFLQEIVIIRGFALAMILVLLIIVVLYLNYLLLGQFFFCLFLAQITSTSLRPYKDAFIAYCHSALEDNLFLLNHSYIYLLGVEIYQILRNYLTYWSIVKAASEVCSHAKACFGSFIRMRRVNQITFFNDGWTILIVMLTYIGITKIGV